MGAECIVIRAFAEDAHVGTAGTPTISIMRIRRKRGPAKTGTAGPPPMHYRGLMCPSTVSGSKHL